MLFTTICGGQTLFWGRPCSHTDTTPRCRIFVTSGFIDCSEIIQNYTDDMLSDDVDIDYGHMNENVTKLCLTLVHRNSIRLRNFIAMVKQSLVANIFRDEDYGSDLENTTFEVVRTTWDFNRNLSQVNGSDLDKYIVKMAATAWEVLAKLVIHINASENDDRLFEVGRSYSRYYADMQYNNEFGLYHLMCSLSQIVQQLSPLSIRRIAQTNPIAYRSSAMRHVRDYIVMRDITRQLRHLTHTTTRIAERLRQ